MSTAPRQDQEADGGLLELHGRLLDGDPAAPALLAERLFPAVLRRLRDLTTSSADPHVVESTVGLVVAQYLRDPESFDPERGSLVSYLAMHARGDVLNELRTRSNRRSREVPIHQPERSGNERVELQLPDRNTDVEEAALDAVDPTGVSPEVAQAMLRAIADFDPVDRQVLQMMADGVRSTGAYAAVLGLAHLPVHLQRRAVKQHKDRIGKRVERLRDRLG